MTEEQLEAYHQKLRKAGVNLMQYGFEIAGVPMGNARKMLDAFDAYVEDARDIASGSGFSFSSTPTSATGQYDRLYNAIAEGTRTTPAVLWRSWKPWARTKRPLQAS